MCWHLGVNDTDARVCCVWWMCVAVSGVCICCVCWGFAGVSCFCVLPGISFFQPPNPAGGCGWAPVGVEASSSLLAVKPLPRPFLILDLSFPICKVALLSRGSVLDFWVISESVGVQAWVHLLPPILFSRGLRTMGRRLEPVSRGPSLGPPLMKGEGPSCGLTKDTAALGSRGSKEGQRQGQGSSHQGHLAQAKTVDHTHAQPHTRAEQHKCTPTPPTQHICLC